MLINFNHLKTFYSAITQKIKSFRGNWNQNDPTADDYIKNRTHWIENGIVEILPKCQQCQPTYIAGQQAFVIEEGAPAFSIGKTYIVNWNDTEYECVAQDASAMIRGAVLLGNGSNMGMSGNGEPFAMASAAFNGTQEIMIMPLDGTTELTLSIYQNGEIVHKLDEKYLPDGLATEEYVDTVVDDAVSNITHPITSVNGKTGAINLTASDVGALPNTTQIPSINGLATEEYVDTELGKKANTADLGDLATKDSLTASDVGAAPEEHEHPYTFLKNIQTVMPNSSGWCSVAHGNGKFVAVASNSNKVAYSEDGKSWVESAMPSSANWASATYGDGKFVAIAGGSDNKSAYNSDGISWTETTLPSSANWRSVTYGNGKFVAVARDSDICAYSEDGITWTTATMPISLAWESVTYGNGKFVAVAREGVKTDICAYSEDGITWTTAAALPISLTLNSVAHGNGKFVAVASISNKVAYSEDGINWKTATMMPNYEDWRSITYGDGKFVAVGWGNQSTSAISEDGITWTETKMPSPAQWESITYGNGKFVAVVYNSNKVAYSEDGINWKAEYGVLEQDHTDITEEIGDVIVESQKLATEEYVDTAVASIEHPTPDWNASEGEVGHVLNRTHYEAQEVVNEPLNITWDGNTEGLESVKLFGGSITSYRVSDATPTVEQLENGGSFIAKFYEDTPYSFGANGLENWSENENVAVFLQKDSIGLVVSYSDGATFADVTFPEKGLYFTVSNSLSEPAYILSLTTAEPVEYTKTVIHTLDPKYLPESVATKEYVNEMLGVIENGTY